MGEPTDQNNRTELQSANIVHSGSGNVLISGNFAPPPTFPVNGSNLPHRYPDFVGRKDEIDKVIEALASRAWIVTIDGPGGIGKTTLALEVAHLCKEHAADIPNIHKFRGYIWTSARGRPEFGLTDVIREILYVLGDYENTSRLLDPSEQLSLAKKALSGGPHLLIIDNFETVKDEPLHRFLRDFPAPNKVLITSRHHLQSGERVVAVGGLDEGDAVQLLRLEAARLQIPLTDQDETRLLIIARKSFGVPLVLRWAMESVYNGKTLEWVVESLEYATADDIFNYIFKLSLSILDTQTRNIFRSMSLLPTWARIETIAALHPDTAAIQERVGQLVSLSLIEDNRKLVQTDRRYQLPSFARYLANKELSDTVDKGKRITEYALNYYLNNIGERQSYIESVRKFLDEESANLSHIVQVASSFRDKALLDRCVELGAVVRGIDRVKGQALFSYLIDSVNKTSDEALTLKLVKSIGSPYIAGAPVTSPDFFGRQELLSLIRSNFESHKVKAPVIALVGHRRIGKTSILRELHHQEPENVKYISLTLEVIQDIDSTKVLYHIAKRIQRELTPDLDEKLLAALGEPSIEDFGKHLYRSFDQFIEQVNEGVGKRLVIMLDEFDMLFHKSDPNDIEHLLQYFRHLAQLGRLNMIIAGVSYPSELPVSLMGSPFFNIALSHTVSFLDRDEAVELIRKPTYELIKFDEEAIERIFTLTGGHPYITQVICSEIFSLCLEKETVIVNNRIVEEALLRVSQSARYFFDYTVRELQEELQRKILVASAHLSSDSRTGKFTFEQLKSSLRSQAVDDTRLKNVLRSLVRREILSASDKGEYSFTMEIIVHWLIKDFLSLADIS